MPKIVGNMSAVREWAFTTQEFSAEDALRVGFVSKVVPGGRDEVIGTPPSLGWLIASVH
jgi:delta(3,5)-delta(2,4)-dienoyl-CoA isomerase